AAVIAREEDLGDLKLYRVPEPVTVAARSQKQVAFLDRERVAGRLLYTTYCAPWRHTEGEAEPAERLLTTVNDARHGLGIALPTGGVTVFESTAQGELLVGEEHLRDHAAGQDVELAIGTSAQVQASCAIDNGTGERRRGGRVPMRLVLTNANPSPAPLRVTVGGSAARVSGLARTRLKDGARVVELTVPANGRRELRWEVIDE
ncbi:MAG: hypothetical protein ACEQR8_02505, partial [Cypionkella sp.]